MGIIGVAVRFAVEIFLFFKTRVYRNSFRFAMFVAAFITQLTGSHLMDVQQYLMWCFAFFPFFPNFNNRDDQLGERTLIGSGSKWGSSARRPRIGIDLHVVDGIFQGSRTHCLELFSRVIEIVPECDFFAFAAETERLLSFSPGFSQPNVTLFPMPEKSSSVRLLWQLPQIARKCELSLLHTQYIVPPMLSCASAVTVHDILFESHPEYFEKLFVHRSRLLVRSSVRKSSAVFTVSDFSRQQLCQTYAVADQKVHTIPNGVDCARFFPGDAGNDAVTSLGLRRGEYFLTVGRLEPRKNHANLLRAWATLKIPRPLLVMIGQRHFGYDEVLNLIQSLRLESDVRILETVSDDAIAFALSRREGLCILQLG